VPVRFRWEKDFKDTEIGRIPRDWEVRKLGNICKISSGKRPNIVNRICGLYELWGANGLMGFTNDFLQTGEIIVTGRVGTLGNVFYIPKNQKIWVSDNALILNSTNKVVLHFLYYHLQIRKEDIENLNVGSTQPLLTQRELKTLNIPLPSLPEQSRIAAVLSWFDELIEVKKKQNEILEKTAMAIFKSWFIDFEPFKDEEFVYSEELGREIPKGWGVKRLEEIAYIIRGISFKAEIANFKPFYNSVPILRANNIRKSWEIDFSNLMFIPKQKVKKHQILKEKDFVMVASNGNPKLVGKFSLFIPLISKTSFSVGAFMYIVRPKLPEYVYLYCLLKSLYFQEFLESIISGTNINNLKKADLENFMFVFPPSYILTKFHSLVQPLFEKIINNQKEIMILKKVRDTLLPLLVFGKLRVEEI